MRLHGYWRSSSSYRVRIALNLKGIAYDTVPVNLVARDHESAEYAALNPAEGVPVLELADGTILTQSMAILEWLDETHPAPPLLPADPVARANARAAALVIASEVHPVNNLRVLNRLKAMGHSQDQTVDWTKHWMARGFQAFARLIDRDAPFAFGTTPTFADLCLVPQIYNGRRLGLNLSPFPRLTEIEARCLALPAFDAASPEFQPDAN